MSGVEVGCKCPCHTTTLNGPLAAHTGPCGCVALSGEALGVLNEVKSGDLTRMHALMDADPLPAEVAVEEREALTVARCSTCGHQARHHEPYPYLDGVVCKTRRNKAWCECPLNRYEALLASDWLRDHDAAILATHRTRAHTAADEFAAEFGHAHPWVAKIRALGGGVDE